MKHYMVDRILHCIVHAFLWISVVSLIACDSRKDPNQRTYESSYKSSSTATGSSQERAYVDNSLNTGNSPYKSKEPSIEENPYYNNSLSTGSSPYSSYGGSAADESQISVSTSVSSNCDVVVIVKSRGRIARNAYIEAGNSYTFNVPNGTYQVFSMRVKDGTLTRICQTG